MQPRARPFFVLKQTFAIAAIATLATACVDGLAFEESEQAIIGGQETSPSEFPTVVGLEGAPGNWDCTGTLIDPEWVLTAAHCVEPGATLQIRFDATDIASGTEGTVVEVSEIHAHPLFNEDIWDHDIAVLKLATPMTDRAITPVHRQLVAPGTDTVQVGYGESDTNGNGSGRLRMLESQNADCATTGDPEILVDRLLCFDASDGTAGCNGDSGGPAFVYNGERREVAGVNSGNTGDTCTQGWELLTLVAAEIDFVDQFVPLFNEDNPNGGDPNGGDPNGGDPDGRLDAGCSLGGAGAESGGLLAISLALMFLWTRRKQLGASGVSSLAAR